MEIKKYMHVERWATEEVDNIQLGHCFVFPKIDGTNSSVWLDNDGELAAGSRNRVLALGNDNAGFLGEMLQDDNILAYLREHPTHRLYGEWLVPHTLKTYREEAWRKFWIFDVSIPIQATECDYCKGSGALDEDTPCPHCNGSLYIQGANLIPSRSCLSV